MNNLSALAHSLITRAPSAKDVDHCIYQGRKFVYCVGILLPCVLTPTLAVVINVVSILSMCAFVTLSVVFEHTNPTLHTLANRCIALCFVVGVGCALTNELFDVTHRAIAIVVGICASSVLTYITDNSKHMES